MKIIVTPLDIHPRTEDAEPFYDKGEPFVGTEGLVVEPGLVKLDGRVVLYFEEDDEALVEGFTPHNWLDTNDHPWTGFSVEIEP
jgi:hypothetical protein